MSRQTRRRQAKDQGEDGARKLVDLGTIDPRVEQDSDSVPRDEEDTLS